MIYITSITKKGQMTIPKKVRKILGIKENNKVILEINAKNKTFKIGSVPQILELAGKFKVKKAINPIKIRRYMERQYQRA